MTNSEVSISLASYLADAATQWAYMRPRQNDLDQIRKNRNLIYAIDSNIMAFWANPDSFSRSGPDDEKSRIQLGTGQVFQSDPLRLSSAISRGLAGFIFGGRLTPRLLIAPPIHLEVEGRILALAAEKDYSSDGKIAEQIRGIELQLSTAGFSLGQLQEVAPRLQELLFFNLGAPSEVRRMSQILKEERAVTLSGLSLPEEVEKILRPAVRLEAWYAYGKKRQGKRDYKAGVDPAEEEGWDRRLERTAKWNNPVLRDHDAEVLSRLEVWNERLSQLEKITNGARNWRVLYITADHRLLRAGASFKPGWTESHFTEDFLRHPRAFLDEEGVLRLVGRERQPESGHVANWFRLLVGSLQMTEDERAEYVRNRKEIPLQFVTAAKKLENGAYSKAAEELQKDWAKFTRDAVTANPPTEFDLSGLDLARRRGASSLRAAVERLDKEIERARLASLDNCISTMTALGFELEFRSRHRARARAVMPIFFERWPKAEAFIQAVGTWGDNEFNRIAYDKGISELRQDDPTDYAYYLAHAALFAGRGRWRAGALLANRARESIRLISPKQRNGSNGREAAYFEAACRRHGAKNALDLQYCPPLVEEAKRIFAAESAIEPGLDVAAERFDAEMLACRLDKLLFIRFPNKNPPTTHVTEDEDNFAILSRDYAQLLRKVEIVIGAAQSRKDHGGKNRSPLEVRKRLRTRLLMNLTAIGLMEGADATICGRAQYAIRIIEELSTKKELNVLDRRSSMFSIFYFWIATCGQIRMSLGTPRSRELSFALDDFFRNEMNNSDYEVFPYDRARFDEMRRTAEQPWPNGTKSSLNLDTI